MPSRGSLATAPTHMGSPAPTGCPSTMPLTVLALQCPPADGDMLRALGARSLVCPGRKDGCGEHRGCSLAGCPPCLHGTLRPGYGTSPVAAGGSVGRTPGTQRVPPPGSPAECTSSLAQLPAPSPVLCLQPPLPGCRVTCQQPPAPGTPRPPARQPPAPGVRPSPLPHPPAPALGGQSRGQPNSGPSPSAATPTQLRIPPRHGHPRAPPRRDSTPPGHPVTTVPRVPAR